MRKIRRHYESKDERKPKFLVLQERKILVAIVKTV